MRPWRRWRDVVLAGAFASSSRSSRLRPSLAEAVRGHGAWLASLPLAKTGGSGIILWVGWKIGEKALAFGFSM
jgi:hypothetical protein